MRLPGLRPLRAAGIRLAWTLVILSGASSPSPAVTGWVVESSPTTASLYSVQFADPDHGWAAGDRGTILATGDGGTNWAVQTSGTAYDLRGIGFSDPDHGIAVGAGGTILRTTDGGAAWQVIRTDWMDGFTGLHVLDQDRAWACGSNAIFQPWVARTTDGGLDWTFYNFYIQNNEAGLTDIRFIDPLTGLATAAIWDGRGAVVRSVDGGMNWAPAIITPRALLSIDFSDVLHGLACGMDGTLYRSVDGGLTWSAIPSGSGHWLYGISFPAPTTASIVGEAGTILRTTNGGAGWNAQQSPTAATLRRVDFIDRMVGTAVGDGGVILHTDTGGESGAGVDRPFDEANPGSTARLTVPRSSFPNPFRGATSIPWQLALAASVRIDIVDPAGRRVRSVDIGPRGRGWDAWEWNGRDDQDRLVARGAYLCRIRAIDETGTGVAPTHGEAASLRILFLGR